MALSPAVLERFGGLRLATDPGEVGLTAATDMLNVDLSRDRTQIFTRDGSVVHTTGFTATPLALNPANFAAGERMLVGGLATSTTAFLNSADLYGGLTNVGTWATTNAGLTPMQIMAFGTPTSRLAFIAHSGATLRKYDGTTLSTASGKPGFLATTPQSNRLVQAWFNAAADTPTGVNGTQSTVYFSDPGLPTTFSTNNYVHLHPGDGEQIRGMVTWRDLLFVFKESRAFVFYGESTDSTGKPVFNYRQVTLSPPLNVSFQNYQRVVASSLGVYFLTSDGVYRTNGGPAMKVSSAIDGVVGATELQHLSVAGDRILFNANTHGHYVFDERNEEWLYWEFAPGPGKAPIVQWPAEVNSDRPVMYAAGTTLYRTDASTATDAGSVFASRYRTGVSDMGSPMQKVIREMVLEGSGVVNVGMGVDWAANPMGTPVTLGTAPAVGYGRSRTAVRGRNVRLQLDAASGLWLVNRVVMNVRSQRPVGVESM